MTIFVPLDPSAPLPPSPHFLVPSAEPTTHVQKVIKAILKARRVAVLCGAGISVRAGIPDFRSETGLFQTLKKDHSSLSSGKDLFDAAVFNSEATTALFCKMVAGLADLAKVAQPTSFHHMLRALDDRGRLLRVYTQNIDALEMKAGLTFGVPELDVRRTKTRSPKSVSDTEAPLEPSANTAGRLPTPPAETPRCIPLHGTLQAMHCQICLHSFPLDNYVDDLNTGTFPICPDCSQVEATRQAVGKRSRGIGKLRPSVVLYNEMHKDGEEVGEVVTRDLVGSSKGKGRAGADLLIVVGTSLRVPGTKRMVRMFSKAIHSRSGATSGSQGEESTAGPSTFSGPSSQSNRQTGDDDAPVKTIYLNLDFPVPTREWEGVFDVWIRGDAQSFAQLVQQEIQKEDEAREAALERKRKREETKAEAAAAAARAEEESRKQEERIKAKHKVKAKANTNPRNATVLGGKKRKPGGDILALPQPDLVKKRKLSHDTNGMPDRRIAHTHSNVSPDASAASTQEKLFLRFHSSAWAQATGQNHHPSAPTPPSSKGEGGNAKPPSQDSYFSLSTNTSPLTSLSGSNLASPAIVTPSCRENTSSPYQFSSSSLSPCPSSPMDDSPPHYVEHSSAHPSAGKLTFPPPEPPTPDSPLSPREASPPPSPPSALRQGFNKRSIIPPSIQRRRPTQPMRQNSRTKGITRPSHLPDFEDEPSVHNETSAQDTSRHTFGHVQHRESYARADGPHHRQCASAVA